MSLALITWDRVCVFGSVCVCTAVLPSRMLRAVIRTSDALLDDPRDLEGFLTNGQFARQAVAGSGKAKLATGMEIAYQLYRVAAGDLSDSSSAETTPRMASPSGTEQ